MRGALTAWRTVHRQQKACNKIQSVMSDHLNRQSLELALDIWITFSRRQHRLKGIEIELQQILGVNRLRNIWDDWRYQFMILQHIKQVQAIKRDEIMRDCFIGWKAYSEKEKAMRTKTTFVEYICLKRKYRFGSVS